MCYSIGCSVCADYVTLDTEGSKSSTSHINEALSLPTDHCLIRTNIGDKRQSWTYLGIDKSRHKATLINIIPHTVKHICLLCCFLWMYVAWKPLKTPITIQRVYSSFKTVCYLLMLLVVIFLVWSPTAPW